MACHDMHAMNECMIDLHVCMVGWMNAWMHACMNECTHACMNEINEMNEWINELITYMNERLHDCMIESLNDFVNDMKCTNYMTWMNGMPAWINDMNECMTWTVWMNEWMNEWMDEWINEWLNEWFDACLHACVIHWLNERMTEWMTWINACMNKLINERNEWMV